MLDDGRVIAEGTPEALKARLGGDRVEVVRRSAPTTSSAAAALVSAAADAPAEVDGEALRVSAPAADRVGVLTGVVSALAGEGIAAADIGVRRPTLDEVFLDLTDRDRAGGGGMTLGTARHLDASAGARSPTGPRSPAPCSSGCCSRC